MAGTIYLSAWSAPQLGGKEWRVINMEDYNDVG